MPTGAQVAQSLPLAPAKCRAEIAALTAIVRCPRIASVGVCLGPHRPQLQDPTYVSTRHAARGGSSAATAHGTARRRGIEGIRKRLLIVVRERCVRDRPSPSFRIAFAICDNLRHGIAACVALPLKASFVTPHPVRGELIVQSRTRVCRWRTGRSVFNVHRTALVEPQNALDSNFKGTFHPGYPHGSLTRCLAVVYDSLAGFRNLDYNVGLGC
eukprot:6523-Rhodomonas_salina.2